MEISAQLVFGKGDNEVQMEWMVILLLDRGVGIKACITKKGLVSAAARIRLSCTNSLSFTETPASLSITIEVNVHTLLRANPCWGSLEWVGWVGAPKQGKTTGIPPRTGLLPSSAALLDTNKRSTGSVLEGLGAFQDTTVAP